MALGGTQDGICTHERERGGHTRDRGGRFAKVLGTHVKIRLACCKRSLAPGLPLGDRATATGREPGPPSSVECSKLPPPTAARRACTHSHPGQNKEGSGLPRAHGAVAAGPRKAGARDGGVDRHRDRQTPMHHGRCPGGGGAADARGLTGRRDRLPAGTEASRGSPWAAQAGGLLRCSRGARATRVACRRRARGARGGCRARCSAGRAGARSAPGERRRQVSCALGSRARLSPPGRPAARSRHARAPPPRARPRAPPPPPEPREAGARPRGRGCAGRGAARAPQRPAGARRPGGGEVHCHPRCRGPSSHPGWRSGLAPRGGGAALPRSPVTYFVPEVPLRSPVLQRPASPRLSLNCYLQGQKNLLRVVFQDQLWGWIPGGAG